MQWLTQPEILVLDAREDLCALIDGEHLGRLDALAAQLGGSVSGASISVTFA